MRSAAPAADSPRRGCRTVSHRYELGSGYGHVALSVEDLDSLLEHLAEQGIEPDKPRYHPGDRSEIRICFVTDPDGYRTELIDVDLQTPHDPEG